PEAARRLDDQALPARPERFLEVLEVRDHLLLAEPDPRRELARAERGAAELLEERLAQRVRALRGDRGLPGLEPAGGSIAPRAPAAKRLSISVSIPVPAPAPDSASAPDSVSVPDSASAPAPVSVSCPLGCGRGHPDPRRDVSRRCRP